MIQKGRGRLEKRQKREGKKYRRGAEDGQGLGIAFPVLCGKTCLGHPGFPLNPELDERQADTG